MPKFIPRTNRQNSAFHKLVGKWKFDTEAKAQFVFDITKGRTESSKEMSFDEMNCAIEKLGGTPFQSKEKRQTRYFPKNVVGLDPISKDAIRVMEEYRAKLPRLESDLAFQKLCLNVIKKVYPTRVRDGQKMIECLKAMSNRAVTTTADLQEVA
jgi:hypothetical protein